MKYLALLLILLAGVSACTSRSDLVRQSERTVVYVNVGDDGHCSGTVIGRHAVLTATHCFASGAPIGINGKPVVIERRIDDGNDHSIIIVDREYQFFARIGRAPSKGDWIYIVGNPGEMRGQFRSGDVSGEVEFFGSKAITSSIQAFGGDSGSGIFGADGELVGCLSGVDWQVDDGPRIQFMVFFPLAFSPAQWAAAYAA